MAFACVFARARGTLPLPDHPPPPPRHGPRQVPLDLLYTVLTLVFTGELAIMLVAYPVREFVKDRFNVFDAFIVAFGPSSPPRTARALVCTPRTLEHCRWNRATRNLV